MFIAWNITAKIKKDTFLASIDLLTLNVISLSDVAAIRSSNIYFLFFFDIIWRVRAVCWIELKFSTFAEVLQNKWAIFVLIQKNVWAQISHLLWQKDIFRTFSFVCVREISRQKSFIWDLVLFVSECNKYVLLWKLYGVLSEKRIINKDFLRFIKRFHPFEILLKKIKRLSFWNICPFMKVLWSAIWREKNE